MKILWVESRDFSQAEKDITACKVEQIHKMTPIFTQQTTILSENSCVFPHFSKQSYALVDYNSTLGIKNNSAPGVIQTQNL